VAATDPSVDDIVLVVQRVLILVIHLNKIQRVVGSWLCLCVKFLLVLVVCHVCLVNLLPLP
jgi:hypothetical protein